MPLAQIEAVKALAGCTFLPRSYEKRFDRYMAAIATTTPEKPLTEKQLAFLEKLLHRYRNQLGGLYHYQQVSGEPRPEPGSVVLGGQNRKLGRGDAVLGGQNGFRTKL